MRDSIILFDDECILCNKCARWIIKNDKQRRFKFLALQSSSANTLLDKYGFDKNNFDSVILIDEDKLYTESDAALRIVKYLDGAKKYLYILRILPKSFRDFFYKIIARNRYKWFGKTDICSVDRSRMME